MKVLHPREELSTGRCFFPVLRWMLRHFRFMNPLIHLFDALKVPSGSFPLAFRTSFNSTMWAVQDMHGKENHLVKVQGVANYKVPEKDAPQLVDPLKNKKKKKKLQK